MIRLLGIFGLVCCLSAYANDKTTDADNHLPNVLILGDSISIGYTSHVKMMLKGKANIFRPMAKNGKKPENCAGTTHGVQRIDEWLKGRKYAVIHFNWGLHDLKHINPTTKKNSNKMSDPRQAEPEVYKKQLAETVKTLKATGAKLIFATTTPYPDGVQPARLPADAKAYNDIALKVMKEHEVKVNDLYGFVLPKLNELQIPKTVHFKGNGSKALAEKVAEAIKKHL
ncbi:hypothetical protein BVX99_01270 [bacterium F16]|nr:hypothetical protein BVX99_01270 [bacterium F16]